MTPISYGHWENRRDEDLRKGDGTKIHCVWDSMTLMDQMVQSLHNKDFKFKPNGIALGENPYGDTALIVWATKNGYGIEINIMNEHKKICFSAGPTDAKEPKYEYMLFNDKTLVEANHFFVTLLKEAEDMDTHKGGFGV